MAFVRTMLDNRSGIEHERDVLSCTRHVYVVDGKTDSAWFSLRNNVHGAME
jgi:hypothetical protein